MQEIAIPLYEYTFEANGSVIEVQFPTADAYYQPAVETGKRATFGLMGREGFGEWKAKVDAALAETDYRM